METKQAVQRQFGAVAERYAGSAVHIGGPDLVALLEAAALRGDERVLDAGCGTGHTALAIAPRAASVIGVDLTEEMLAQARRLAGERGLQNVSFVRGDVEQLDFPDGAFDLVTSRYSAHHYSHPERALQEIRRVLAPGGAFLLVDVVVPPEPVIDTYTNAIELLRDPSHVRDHSVAQWLDMLAIAGFNAEHLGTWPLRLAFDDWVQRMQTPADMATQIKRLLDVAPREVHDALRIEDDHSFTITVALLRAHISRQ